MDMQKEIAIRRWNNLAVAALKDEAAFDELYDHFFPLIYNVIYARVKNTAIADDVVGDTFMKMTQSLASFDPERASFSTWLSRIAMRTLTDYYRWQSHRQNVEWDDVFSPAVDEKERPEGHLLEKEGKSELLLALGKLGAGAAHHRAEILGRDVQQGHSRSPGHDTFQCRGSSAQSHGAAEEDIG